MDGVIVDSEPILREAVGRLFAEKGVEAGPDDWGSVHIPAKTINSKCRMLFSRGFLSGHGGGWLETKVVGQGIKAGGKPMTGKIPLLGRCQPTAHNAPSAT